MRRTIFLPLLVCALLSGPALCHARAGQTNEAQLIEILQSGSATPREKDGACAQLKLIGTKQSVKALAALLTDEQLSHSARYALESMSAPEAGKALRNALGKTSGLTRVGIINSLAIRQDSAAVPDLGKLLSGPDQAAAVASAEALGRIGGSRALKLLQSSASNSSGTLHQAEIDGILMCASRLLDAGKKGDALKVFKSLYRGEKAEPVRQAALSGMILTAGKSGFAVAVDAIANGDPASRSAALHLAARLPGTEATRAFADLAIGAKAPVQVALIECLVQRGDPAALPAINELAGSADASVRVAAIAALGSLGDDSVVQLLAEKAATSSGAERNAARESLLELNRGTVTKKMLALMNAASPKVKSELILALGGRGDSSATPALLNLAQRGNDFDRPPALQALGQLADTSQIPALVQLVIDAQSEELRSAATDALGGVYERLELTDGKPGVDELVKAVTSGSVETRLALLPICSELPQASVRGALRAAIADGDARIHEAGIHALCDTHDRELLPDLLDLAGGKGDEVTRHLAIRGCVHLISQEEDVKFPAEKKLEVFKKILGGTLDAGEKRLVLSGLGSVGDERALALATGLLDDTEVRAEAEQAVIKIADLVRVPHPAKARTALKKVVTETKNEDNRKAAQALLNKIK